MNKGQFYYHWWDSVVTLRRVILHLNLEKEKISLMGHSRGGSVVFLYAATYPDEVEKLICIDSAFPQLKTPETIVENTKMNIDKFLQYDNQTGAEPRCFNKELMIDIAHDAYGGSVTRESCEVLMRRGMVPSPSKPGMYYFTRDPKIKLSGLGVFSKDLAIAYAKKITCEYLNIRAVPGVNLVYNEFYYDILDVIKQSAKRFEFHKVAGTHHLHLNDAPSVASIISSFITT